MVDYALDITSWYIDTIHDLSFKSLQGIAYATSSIVAPAVMYAIDGAYHPI